MGVINCHNSVTIRALRLVDLIRAVRYALSPFV
jgi:hypothetical protein